MMIKSIIHGFNELFRRSSKKYSVSSSFAYYTKNRNTFILMLLIISLFLCYFIKTIIFLDPDFGWHIRMGEVFLKTGFSYTDPFSYTMPSFPFIDHEWFTNLMIAKLYHFVGYPGLTIIFVLIALVTNVFQMMYFRNQFSVLLFILQGGTLLNFIGVRPQVISWFFASILAFVMFDKVLWKRVRYFFPLFVILWVNTHGSFAFGIGVISIYFTALFFINRKIDLSNLLILFGCIIASLINPYGYKIWYEVFMQFSDSSLRFSISEWLPSIFFANIPMWLYTVLSVSFVIRYFRKFYFPYLVIYSILLLLGLSSIRHMPLWMIFSFPVTTRSLMFFASDVKRIKEGESRFKKAFAGLIVLTMLIFTLNLYLVLEVASGEKKFYPLGAIGYLKNNLPDGNIFSLYDWGGYLIWKMPEKKVFVDGRMPSWRWKSPYSLQSDCAFCEYQKVMLQEMPFSKIQKKYNITTVLLPTQVVQEHLVYKLIAEIEKKTLSIFNFGEKKNVDLYKQLERYGMKIVYKDENAVVYQIRNP